MKGNGLHQSRNLLLSSPQGWINYVKGGSTPAAPLLGLAYAKEGKLGSLVELKSSVNALRKVRGNKGKHLRSRQGEGRRGV